MCKQLSTKKLLKNVFFFHVSLDAEKKIEHCSINCQKHAIMSLDKLLFSLSVPLSLLAIKLYEKVDVWFWHQI